MQSSLYGMIDKAHRYADEPDRVRLTSLTAQVRGDNDEHTVSLSDEHLVCNCDHYKTERICAHVLTLERVLKAHLPPNSAPFPGQ